MSSVMSFFSRPQKTRHMKKTSPAGHGASSVSLDWLSWPRLLGSQNGGETWAPSIRGAFWVTFGWTFIGKNDGLIYIMGIINCIVPNVIIKNGKWFGVGEKWKNSGDEPLLRG